MEQRQSKKSSFLCLILILLTIFGFALTVPTKAFAEESEETEQTEETKPQADEIVKKMFFFGFRKGEVALCEAVEKELYALKDSGKLAEIATQWFGADITVVGK